MHKLIAIFSIAKLLLLASWSSYSLPTQVGGATMTLQSRNLSPQVSGPDSRWLKSGTSVERYVMRNE